MNDGLTAQIRRDSLERAVAFLWQYAAQLQNSIYPDDQYKLASIEDVIQQIELALQSGR